MSAHKSVEDLPPEGERFDLTKISKHLGILFVVGASCLAVTALLAFNGSWRPSIAYALLFSLIFYFTLVLGGIFWTLLHNATNSGWGVSVRRLMENIGNMMPWMALFALPLLLVPGMRDALWEWIPERAHMVHEAEEYAEHHFDEEVEHWRHEVEAVEKDFAAKQKELGAAMEKATPGEKAFLQNTLTMEEAEVEILKGEEPTRQSVIEHKMHEINTLLASKGGFLNYGFWFVRFVFYFVALTLIIRTLRGWSVKQDADGDLKWTRAARRAACGFLPLFAVAETFAVVDWLMALDYSWFSTMWGVYLFAGSALSSMALLIVVVTYLRSLGYLHDVVNEEHYHVMGKLLHAFVIFWAYISFSQYFLIWYANITEETKFFLLRNTGQWNTVSIMLVIFHFFVPFLLLLRRGAKKDMRVLCALAIYMLGMHAIDMYWIVIPERGPSLGAGVVVQGAFIFDIFTFVGVGAMMAFLFLRSLAKDSLYPCKDPRLDESVNLVN